MKVLSTAMLKTGCTFLCSILFSLCFAQKKTTAKVEVKKYNKFEEISPASIQPTGWLQEFLLRQKSGITGHHDVLDYPFNTNLWNGTISRSGDYGEQWWRYEQTAYLVDGILRLGYLLHDKALIKEGEDNIEYVLTHIGTNDRLGPELKTEWPNVVFFRALKAYYLATQNPRVIPALEKHYLSLDPKTLSEAGRNITSLEGILWTYEMTGNNKLLALAEKAYEDYNTNNAASKEDLTVGRLMSPDTIIMHGVSYMEEAKLPTLLYAYTGKTQYLQAATIAFEKLQEHHMLPDGVPTSNEYLGGKDIMKSHETCDISDYSWSLGYLVMASGNAELADRIEKAIFNAGPGAITKDFKALQYYSSVNQAIATYESDHNNSYKGEAWMAYSPVHTVECCAGNVNRFMPNFAARLFMRDKNGGLVVPFYSPASTDFKIKGTGSVLSVKEITNYPFSDTVFFEMNSKGTAILPFTFRIPAWCKKPELLIDGKPYTQSLKPGSFQTLNLTVKVKSKIMLRFPMHTELIRTAENGLSIQYGPLLFALDIQTKAQKDTAVHKVLLGKHASNPDFPAWNFYPAADWNYALVLNKDDVETATKVIRKANDKYPFDESPLKIRVPVRKVKEWVLLKERFTPALPEAGTYSLGETEFIELVPYGSTCLRISVFPNGKTTKL